MAHAEINVWCASGSRSPAVSASGASETGSKLYTAYVSKHPLSLDFHPSEHLLFIASGNELLVWAYQVLHPGADHSMTG